jgi:6-pyruvoyltetrahydropterin/6-carboxytetrahydropterin synthase
LFYVTKTYDHSLGLSACFRQHRATSHCRFLHGYALSFKLTFCASQTDENGWVIDFGSLKAVKTFLIEHFDHRLIVAEDDPDKGTFEALGQMTENFNPLADVLVLPAVGCEAFAKFVYEWICNWLLEQPDYQARVGIYSVEVREHGGNSAIYDGPILLASRGSY